MGIGYFRKEDYDKARETNIIDSIKEYNIGDPVEYTLPPDPKDFMEYIEEPKDKKPLDIQVGGSHYKTWTIQPIEFLQANKVPPCEANIIKYTCRHREKNGVEDLRKAMHYLQILMEMEYGVTE